MLSTSTTATERYHLGQLLGHGGYADVYLATTDSGHTAAFKVMLEEFANCRDIQQIFTAEAELLGKLAHRNIPKIYGHGEIADGRRYILMEDCGRYSLDEVTAQRGALSDSEACWYGVQICEALSYLHVKNLRHGDLKPRNVVVDDQHRIHLIDFGFTVPQSRAFGSGGIIQGTPHYLAPEVLRGDHTAGFASDVYALGALLYELVTGTTVFSGETPVEVCERQLFQVPVSPSRRATQPLSTNLDTLILRCLQKDPTSRPGVAEIAASLSLELTRAPLAAAA